jgi:hypothetical protein
MLSRTAPRTSHPPAQWVFGTNVLYFLLLSVPAKEWHGMTFTLFIRDTRDTNQEDGVSGLLNGAVSTTDVIWRRMIWGKDLEYRNGHDTLQKRFCNIQIFLY